MGYPHLNYFNFHIQLSLGESHHTYTQLAVQLNWYVIGKWQNISKQIQRY